MLRSQINGFKTKLETLKQSDGTAEGLERRFTELVEIVSFLVWEMEASDDFDE